MKRLFLIGSVFAGTLIAMTARADLGDLGLTNTAQRAELTDRSVPYTGVIIAYYIGRVIEFILAGLGLFFLILIVLAGLKWLLAEGNEETIDKAKSTITQAVWGMLIIAAAYTITSFMVTAIQRTAGLIP